MDPFKRFSKEKLPDKECFYSSVKDERTGDYLTCKKAWNEFR